VVTDWKIDPESIHIQESVGFGSFGKVYKAEYAGSPVTVKEIANPKNHGEIEREIILLAKIRSMCCVRFFGTYSIHENTYIVTEYIEGGSLMNLVVNGESALLGEEVKLKILRDIARGILFLHENNVIHRNLKSANCFVRSTAAEAPAHALVADFGLSKVVRPCSSDSDRLMTQGLGTPIYMAPEVFEERYTPKIDVYSFGVIVNELFSDQTPWSHLNTSFSNEILNLVRRGERPLMNFSDQRFPSAKSISSLINACWAQDPTARPHMHDVVNELDRLIEISIHSDTLLVSNLSEFQLEAQPNQHNIYHSHFYSCTNPSLPVQSSSSTLYSFNAPGGEDRLYATTQPPRPDSQLYHFG